MPNVKFKFTGDDSELRKKLAGLAKLQGDINFGFGKRLSNMGSNAVSEAVKQVGQEAIKSGKDLEILNRIANSNSLRDSKLADMEAMRKARLAIQEEILEQKKLRSAVEQGKITQQEYRSELAKITVEEKKRSIALRDIKKQLSETSEYGKLNKALGELRKQSKDVLAEMFRMERQGHANTIGYEALRKKSEGLVSQTLILDKGIKKIDATLGLHQRNVGNYGEALELISPQIASINQKLQIFGTSLDDLSGKPGSIRELGASFVTMGKGILAFLLSPVGLLISTLGALFLLFKSNRQTVIDFNSGLRNVSKTTELTGKDLRSFGSAIVDLSMKLKVVDATKLLEYATAAGQLGVRGRADILAFTEALAMLETASDIKGEEGASRIARTLTLIDGGVQNVKAFGDEIVNLGNNFAATESEILSNAESISQNVGIYKIGRQQVLAFATATKAVGLEAELVGSTFSRTLGEFEKSLRSGKGVSDLLKVIGGTSQDLSRRFREDAAGVFVDYVKGLNNIYKTGGSVNEALERTGIIAVRDQRVIASLASNGYDVLSDALLKVSDANGAMQQEFENGAGKLENQTKRMGIAWDNFVLSIEDGEGSIGRAVVSIVGFFATLTNEITRLSKSESFGEFARRFTEIGASGDGALKTVEDFKKSYSEIKSVTQSVRLGKIDFEILSDKDLKIQLERFTELKKQAIETSSEYQAAILSKRLSEQGSWFKSSAGNLSLFKSQEEEAKAAYERINKIAKNRGIELNPITSKVSFEEESEKEKLKREKAEAAAAKKAERAMENRRQAVERQRALQLSIDQTNEQVLRNQISRDDQEVASIKDKYAKIQEEIRKFNADPKNKGQKIDASGLVSSEKLEIKEANTKIDTKYIVDNLNQQKALFDQFEAYKLQVGEEKAKERFQNELDVTKSYGQLIEEEMYKLLETDPTQMTSGQRERLEVLTKMQIDFYQQDKAREMAKYAESLQLSQTSKDKLLAIDKKYQDAYEQLEKNKTSLTFEEFEKRKEALKKGRLQESGDIILPDLQKTGDWINVFEKSSQLAVSKVKNSVSVLKTSLEKMLSDGKITVEQYNDALKQINGVEVEVNVSEKGFGRLKQILKELKEAEKGSLKYDQARQKLGQEINYWGQGIVDAGNEALNVADKLGLGSEKFKEDMALTMNLASDAVNLASSIASGDVMGIITNGIKTLSSAISLFTKDRGIERKIQDYQRQIEALGKSYEVLQKKMNGNDTNYYANSDQLIANLKEQQRLLEQSAKAEEDKKKTDKEKVKGYKEQSEAINKQIEDTENAVRQMRLQTDINSLAQSITDALVGAFESGEDGIDAMDKAFDKFIKNSLANSVRLKFVQKIIDDMLNQVDKYMASNDNSIVGFDFTEWDKKLNQAGKEAMDFLESAYSGLKLEKDGTSNGIGLSGAVKRELTEATASELTGLYRSTYDLMKRSFQESTAQGLTLSKQLDIANSSLTALNAIQNNTANTVVRLDSAISELKAVNKNLGGKFSG
ncbi:phage tail tape measure protein [Sphingobacterium faecium]|uniref:phage tail tape measure protein n=1 Tax=Sphingobacterium faecium TaxID=34087 RepID=UPI003DA6083D